MDFFLSIFPILLIFLVFYFLLIRPQAREEKRRRDFIKNLKKGDIVYTSSGIIGKILDIFPDSVILESKDARIRILKSAIQGEFKESKEGDDKKKGEEKQLLQQQKQKNEKTEVKK